jgi:hypothetical protein
MLETSSGRDRRASRAVVRVFSANNPCLPGRAFLHRGVCQEHAASETEGERADHGSNSDQIRTQRERHVGLHCQQNERAYRGGSSCDLFVRPDWAALGMAILGMGSLGKVPVRSSHRQRRRVSGSNPRLLSDASASVARMSQRVGAKRRPMTGSVICGIGVNEKPRISLRSSELRSLTRRCQERKSRFIRRQNLHCQAVLPTPRASYCRYVPSGLARLPPLGAGVY